MIVTVSYSMIVTVSYSMIVTVSYSMTVLSYSMTVVLYSRDQKGVGVSHEITSSKNSLNSPDDDEAVLVK